MRRAAVLVLALLCASGAAHGADTDLQRKQAEARREREALRERIQQLDRGIAGTESSRRDVSTQLKESETAISELDRRLEALAADTQRVGDDLEDLRRRIDEQTAELARRQKHLSEQLRAQYAGGLSPWAALLSGQDPQDISRDLGYLEYVSRAQTAAVRAVRTTLDELASLRQQAQAKEAQLRALASETGEKRAELQAQQAERRQVLANIEKELSRQRGEADRLAGNEQRLSKLVDALAVAIEEQAAEERRRREEEARRVAEAKRIAEEKRRAEAARKAEEARRAEEARQLAAARDAAEQAARAAAARNADAAAKAEEARRIEEARRTAQAIREQQPGAAATGSPAAAGNDGTGDPPGEGMRITGRVPGLAPGAPTAPGTSVASASPDAAGRGADATDDSEAAEGDAGPTAANETRVAIAEPRSAQPVALSGLSKGLPHPVRGEVQGRFGMERPEGGVWRGVVLRAAEGARVGAVAPGRVVYAGWLGGFGNLMIVDHGAKYLTVYAYNQSLLKQVGDYVRTGEVIATVGATGGQVEPGLYFEIRHGGKPVNPLLWLGR